VLDVDVVFEIINLHVRRRNGWREPYQGQFTKHRVGVEKLGSKTRFPSGEFLPVRVFLAVVCFLRGCHRWLRSQVEEPHQSFQVLCHGS